MMALKDSPCAHVRLCAHTPRAIYNLKRGASLAGSAPGLIAERRRPPLSGSRGEPERRPREGRRHPKRNPKLFQMAKSLICVCKAHPPFSEKGTRASSPRAGEGRAPREGERFACTSISYLFFFIFVGKKLKLDGIRSSQHGGILGLAMRDRTAWMRASCWKQQLQVKPDGS